MGYAEAIVTLANLRTDPREVVDGIDYTPFIRRIAQAAEPYYVAPPIGALLGSNPITDTPVGRHLFPVEAAWVHFGEPLPLPCPYLTKWGAVVTRLACVGFSMQSNGVMVYHHVCADTGGGASGIHAWLFGKQAGDFEENEFADKPGAREQCAFVRGVLFAFMSFIQQRILVTSTRPIANKGARKRLRQQLKHEPLVHVVELRRREYQQRDESHDRHVQWSCQWLVRGHWRKQHYAKTKEVRPIWIAPHIKGDPDKPLRAATTTVYEVKR